MAGSERQNDLQLFADLFESNSSPLLLLNVAEEKILYANRAACLFYGYPEPELQGLRVRELLLPGDSAPPLSREGSGLAPLERKEPRPPDRPLERKAIVQRHQLANGELRDVELHATFLRRSSGKELCLLIVHDITETLRLESRVQQLNYNLEQMVEQEISNRLESEQHYRLLFNSGHDAIFIHEYKLGELPGGIIQANDAACRLSGQARDKLSTLTMEELLPPDSVALLHERSAELFERRHLLFESTLLNRKGEPQPVELNIQLFEMNGLQLAFTALRNISERKQLEERKQEEERLFIHQSRMKALREMIGSIAHLWKEPLNAIGLLAQDLEDAFEYGELDKQYLGESVAKIMHEILFMAESVDEFRSFFYASDKLTTFPLSEAVDDILTLLRTQYRNRDITIEFKRDEGMGDDRFEGYFNDLKHVILGLMHNAKDAIELRREQRADLGRNGLITVQLGGNGEWLSISIADNGIGFDEDTAAQLFTPRFTTKGPKGTGMGLQLSRSVIEQKMHGQIVAESGGVGEGAAFTILLQRPHDDLFTD